MKIFNKKIKAKRKSLLLIPLILLMIACLLPFYVMVVGSLKPGMALYNIPTDLVPFTNFNINNYLTAFSKVNFPRAFLNSFIISSGICVITVFIGLTGGFAFAKHNFVGKKFLFIIMMATMMLPAHVMMIPRYMVAKNLSITNTLHGVILTSINCGYAIFLCRQFISNIPDEIIGAAKIDGCSNFRIFIDIILPLSKPVIGALITFTFISSWNDFIWQNIMLTTDKLHTVPLALSHLESGEMLNSLGYKLAGATISSIPMILVFLNFQKYFIKGITGGAVKE